MAAVKVGDRWYPKKKGGGHWKNGFATQAAANKAQSKSKAYFASKGGKKKPPSTKSKSKGRSSTTGKKKKSQSGSKGKKKSNSGGKKMGKKTSRLSPVTKSHIRVCTLGTEVGAALTILDGQGGNSPLDYAKAGDYGRASEKAYKNLKTGIGGDLIKLSVAVGAVAKLFGIGSIGILSPT